MMSGRNEPEYVLLDLSMEDFDRLPAYEGARD